MTKFVKAQKIPTTVKQFAEICRTLDNDLIYDFFGFDISEELRGDIICEADIGSNEPVRQAFNRIGEQYDVQSLKDY